MSLNLHELRCKTCGEPLSFAMARGGIVKCSTCDSVFTLPKNNADQKVLDFLSQGEHDLDTSKFDDAYSAYAKAAELDPTEPEAYWGMALADFKVQYLKDEVNRRLQPICHEMNDKIFADDINVCKAIRYATHEQRDEYERKAKEIDYIKKEFAKISKHGTDYDCFICVKVSDGTGGKTPDYKIAEDIYFALRKKGYKPFLSELELSDVAGADYEARILYALRSAKCMLIVCTDETYLRTPWVKNEYTRFLKLVNDEEKESDSITFVYRDYPIERLPGRPGKVQSIAYNLTAMEKIIAFVDKHSGKKKHKKEKSAPPQPQASVPYEVASVPYQKPPKTSVKARKKFTLKSAITLICWIACILTAFSIVMQSVGLYVFNNTVLTLFKAAFGIGVATMAISLFMIFCSFGNDKVAEGWIHILLTIALVVITIFGGISKQLDIVNYYQDAECGVVYAEKADKNVVWGLNGKSEDIVITGTVNGVTVKEVRKNAFKGNKNLHNVTFESCSVNIGKAAFKNCNRLETVNINDAICVLGGSSFNGCPSLKKFCLNNASLRVIQNLPQITVSQKGACSYYAGEKSAISTLIIEDGESLDECVMSLTYTEWTGIFKQTTFYNHVAGVVYIPKSVTKIPDNFFGTNSSYTTVYYAGSSEDWAKISIGTKGNDNYPDKVTVNFNSPYGG